MRRRHAVVGVALLLVVAGVMPAALLTSGGGSPEPPVVAPSATPEAPPEPSAGNPKPLDAAPEPSTAAPSAPPHPLLAQSGATIPTTPEAASKPSATESPATPEAVPTVPPAAAETGTTPPEPPVLSYTRLDTTGQATTTGSYAFLDPTGRAVTTYEGLRDGSTAALLVHKHDAHGASQAALYDAVEPGDLVEWRQADDCFVRYQVTAVKPDPAGTAPRKLLAVAWMTYAFAGCERRVIDSRPVQRLRNAHAVRGIVEADPERIV